MISCQQYDYLEIACLYHFLVRITLKDQSVYEGIARDTRYNEHHQECLLIEIKQEEILLPTELMLSLQALTDNPHFSLIEFNA
ncbi:Rho-binding antiterminator [Vibrio scophthalmi]|uniref:Rho-binding antiterminator n=1 Tax=Vibrio scophthalmi TaxID=45658 RepID=UPI0022851AD3|nr:Rho-binding antiterminator [Vibrio scophthalmi]MCY9802765.1 Rho-binding antiterminator [Vibrio scophthalmi]